MIAISSAKTPTSTTGAGKGFVISEVPTGTLNGSNTVFTTSKKMLTTPMPILVLNGVVQNPFGGSPDATFSGNTITYTVAPSSTDWHAIWYWYEVPSGFAFPLYGTGLNDDFTLGTGGKSELHWLLKASIDPIRKAALIVKSGFLWSGWHANLSDAQWIAPDADETASVDHAAIGNYTYELAFDLSLYNPATVSVTGNILVDDSVTLFLNGVSKATGASLSVLAPFTINSGFVTGINKLTAVVNNTNAISTGLLVEITATAGTLL